MPSWRGQGNLYLYLYLYLYKNSLREDSLNGQRNWNASNEFFTQCLLLVWKCFNLKFKGICGKQVWLAIKLHCNIWYCWIKWERQRETARSIDGFISVHLWWTHARTRLCSKKYGFSLWTLNTCVPFPATAEDTTRSTATGTEHIRLFIATDSHHAGTLTRTIASEHRKKCTKLLVLYFEGSFIHALPSISCAVCVSHAHIARC